ncbi:MAG: Transcriptional activator of maltose regulon, MalT [Nitrospira sp.]|nr:Transcriptional activator of maltose regulon, MalT [Nitrospira sp.]
MPRRAAALAKLTPPRLYAITRRERLFTLLKEQCRRHPLIWIVGPPGAGKTSLVASYLAAHKQRTLWYHMDSGDADLSTFFHYLAQGAQAAAGRRKLRLPALTPEFMADVPGFTRRFMRELWSKVPLPAVLVLDNYQELSIEALLHKILPIALAEFPAGAALIVISRGEAPGPFARELVHNGMGHIRWEDLKLTLEETALLAGPVSDVDEKTVRSLHAKANGWVAGTILLLERMKAKETLNTPHPSETKTEVFHYFAEQVFMRTDLRTREVLMRTALLPWMTEAISEEVSEHRGSAHIVRDLYQRGLFVDRRADAQVHYQYHDLFREFLINRCHVHFDAEALQSIKRTAAQVAERYGQQDTAVALYAETQSWDELSRLICGLAEKLLSQGRNQTLQKYISLFPQEERQYRPWLLYWSGISRLVFDPITARKDLEHAHYHFETAEQQDVAGLFLSCSGIIESYICGVDDMAPAIIWGDRVQQLLHQNNGFPSPTIEARVLTHLQGLMYAASHHPLLAELEKSVDRILSTLDDPAGRFGVVTTFVNLPLWRGDFRRVRHMLDQLNPYMESALIQPVTRLCWNVMEANYAWNVRNHAQAKEKLSQAFAIAEQFGIVVFKPQILGISTYNALAAGDDKEGERLADIMATEIQPHQRLAQGQRDFYRAGIALIRNDLPSAFQYATSALNTHISICLPFMTGNCRVGLAKVLVELGELAKAREQLNAALEYARIMRSSSTEVHCLLTEAQIFFKEGQVERGNESLRGGLRIAARMDYLVLEYWWRPTVMAELLAHALEADIEVEFVRSVIRRRDLRAPSAALKHWPYPVKIATLGRFEVAIDDVLLTYSGKTQRKPLELLKYLCVAGAQGIHQDLIEESLWPDADGEAADQAFRTTLHRLRKLLRHDDAVRLSHRHISLDPALVSLDHLAFERLAQDVDRTDAVALEQVLALYRGHFLQGETASWILPVRERLRAHFLDLTERLGAALEERGEVHEAAQKYLHAMDVEPVAEVMCRRVMMTYVRLGRRSEAIGVYQRFSHALHTKLGIPPTQETVSLYHTITTP